MNKELQCIKGFKIASLLEFSLAYVVFVPFINGLTSSIKTNLPWG